MAPSPTGFPAAVHPLTVHPLTGRFAGLPPLPLTASVLDGQVHFQSDVKEPSRPLSPLTSLVEKSLASQPAVAFVHDVPIYDALEQIITPRDILRPCSRELPSVQGRQHSRPPSAGRAASVCSSGSGSQSRPRELSTDEVKSRQDNTLEWFRAAQCINQKARNSAEAGTLLEQARRRRSDGGSRPASREPSECRTAARHVLCCEERRETSRDMPRVAKEVEVRNDADEAPSKCISQPGAPRSLMDQFGYGVILKTQPQSSPRKQEVIKAASPVRRRSTMIEIKAGGNDLHQRLAARRSTLLQ